MYRVVLFALVVGALAELRLPGRCDVEGLKYLSLENLSPSYLNKTWYVVATFGSEWFGGDCPTIITRRNVDSPNNELMVQKLFVENKKTVRVSRTLEARNNALIKNLNSFTEAESPIALFYFLNSDLENFSLAYTCVQESPETRIVNGHFYSTNKILSPEYKVILEAISRQYEDLQKGPWKIHDHSKCQF